MASVNSGASHKVRRGRPATGRLTVRRLLEKKRIRTVRNDSIANVSCSESTPLSELSQLSRSNELSTNSSSGVVSSVTDSASVLIEHFLLPEPNASREFIAGKVSVLRDIINAFENVGDHSELIAYCDLQLMLLEPMLN